MSKLIILFAAVLAAFSSCADLSSENVKNGANEVLQYYGGTCKYNVGKGTSTEKGGSYRYLELELENSEIVTELVKARMHPMVTSNIAYLMYKNLSPEERTHFDYVNAVLVSATGKELEKDYATGLLDTVLQRMEFVNKIVTVMKAERYDELRQYANAEVVPAQMDSFIVMMKTDTVMGKMKDFVLMGFVKHTTEEGNEYLKVTGTFVREKQNHHFNVVMDLGKPEEKFVQLGLKI